MAVLVVTNSKPCQRDDRSSLGVLVYGLSIFNGKKVVRVLGVYRINVDMGFCLHFSVTTLWSLNIFSIFVEIFHGNMEMRVLRSNCMSQVSCN